LMGSPPIGTSMIADLLWRISAYRDIVEIHRGPAASCLL